MLSFISGVLLFLISFHSVRAEEPIVNTLKSGKVYVQVEDAEKHRDGSKSFRGQKTPKTAKNSSINRNAAVMKIEKKGSSIESLDSKIPFKKESVIRLEPIKIIGVIRHPSVKFVNDEPEIEVSEPGFSNDFIGASSEDSLGL